MAACTLLEWVSLLLLVSTAAAYDFYVGGRDGWVANPSEPFNHWAGRNRFQVDDKLVFKYTKGEDSVLLVTKEAYESCDTANPIVRMEEGNSVFRFDSSGSFFFVSGAPGRCGKGEKMSVVVMAARPSSRSTAPTPLAAAPSLPPSSSASFQSLWAPAPSPAEASSATSYYCSTAGVAWVVLGLAVLVGA